MIWNYIFALLLIVPVNLIFYLVLKPTIMFWGYTLIVWLLMPMAAFLIATVFLVPYIKIIDFISNKYWLIFLILSAIVIGAFLLYSGLLSILQSLMETGSIHCGSAPKGLLVKSVCLAAFFSDFSKENLNSA